MFTRPDAIEDATIIAALRDGWGFAAVSVEYLPVGFGSHHWVARAADGERRFVTVDDLASRDFLGSQPREAFHGLTKAFATAQALRDTGLDWVVGPCIGTRGQVLTWLLEPYSIAVFPYAHGVTTARYESEAERSGVIDLLAGLHAHTHLVVGIARRETFAVPNRADLEAAIASVSSPWTSGPYAEPARALLREHLDGVQRHLAEYDRLVAEAPGDPNGWTITHGEPHSSNVMRTEAGLRLIDWDTTLVAPPERDLWMLVDSATQPEALRYTAATGRAVEPRRLRLYALWWDLCEIAIYIAGFRKPHDDTEDAAESWDNLQHFITPL